MQEPRPIERMAFSIREFCDRNAVSRTTVYVEAKRGRLRITKIGGKSIVLAEHEKQWRDSLPALGAS